MLKLFSLLGLIFLVGCSYNTQLDESQYECTNGWWTQYTSKEGMEFDGQLPYDFENNPQEYYDSMAKELNFKLKDCGYNTIDDLKMYGCSICYNWTELLKPIEINLEEEKCVEHTFDYVDGLHCDRNNKSTYSALSKSGQEQWDRFCCIKKEKLSEVEKLMDKDCYWLLKDMMDSCGQYKRDTRTICEEKKQHYRDLKTAFKEKGCEI